MNDFFLDINEVNDLLNLTDDLVIYRGGNIDISLMKLMGTTDDLFFTFKSLNKKAESVISLKVVDKDDFVSFLNKNISFNRNTYLDFKNRIETKKDEDVINIDVDVVYLILQKIVEYIEKL